MFAASSQEIGRLKAQLQQTLASKRMSEDMISSLQVTSSIFFDILQFKNLLQIGWLVFLFFFLTEQSIFILIPV